MSIQVYLWMQMTNKDKKANLNAQIMSGENMDRRHSEREILMGRTVWSSFMEQVGFELSLKDGYSLIRERSGSGFLVRCRPQTKVRLGASVQ